MKSAACLLLFFLVLSTSCWMPPAPCRAEQSEDSSPDSELCAEMIRFGREAYMRGRYLDAKEYFRKAVQADPHSMAAWRLYDQAAIFALAEKVEKSSELLKPDTSDQGRAAAKQASPEPSTPPPEIELPTPEDGGGVIIVDDEGC